MSEKPPKRCSLMYVSSCQLDVERVCHDVMCDCVLQAKTTLNNALMIDLRRLNTKLDYSIKQIPTPYGTQTNLYRCTLILPYPEEVTVIGEGASKKDAERRCAAASCLKLMVGHACVHERGGRE